MPVLRSNLFQQLFRVLFRRQRQQMLVAGEDVVRAGERLQMAARFDGEDVDVVFVSHVHIAHTASDPAVKRRNLVDRVFVRQLDIIKYIPCAQAGRKALCAVALGIDDIVRAVAQKQFGVDVDKRKIVLDADIKAFGTYQCEIKLYPGISAKIYAVVGELE